MLARNELLSTLNGVNPFEEISPWYFEKRYHSAEKHSYLTTIERLAEYIAQNSDLPFIVLGSGGGEESLWMNNALEYVGGDNLVYNLDFNETALKKIKERRESDKERFVCGRVEALPFPDRRFALVTLSSVLHEVQSFDGFSAVSFVFSEAARVTAPGGLILVREFVTPKPEPCILGLATPWGKRFFNSFLQEFRQQQKEEWQKEWYWGWIDEDLDSVFTNSRFAWEVLLHARMFERECRRPGVGDEVAFNFFPSWTELKERYSLASQEHEQKKIARELIQSAGLDESRWQTFSWFVKDTVDDEFLNENFCYWEHGVSNKSDIHLKKIEMERMWLFFHRLPGPRGSSETNGAAREMAEFLDKLPDITCLEKSLEKD